MTTEAIEHKIKIIGTSLGTSRNKNKVLRVTFHDICCNKIARDSYAFEKPTGKEKLQSVLSVIGVSAIEGKLSTKDMLGKKFFGYIYKDAFGYEVVEPTGSLTRPVKKPSGKEPSVIKGSGVKARISMIDWKGLNPSKKGD